MLPGLGSTELSGPLFAVGNILNSFAMSRPVGGAHRVAQHHGLYPHPSSLLLMPVPLAPSSRWAVLLCLAWELLVEMNVPTRQSIRYGRRAAERVHPRERDYESGPQRRKINQSPLRSLDSSCRRSLRHATVSRRHHQNHVRHLVVFKFPRFGATSRTGQPETHSSAPRGSSMRPSKTGVASPMFR